MGTKVPYRRFCALNNLATASADSATGNQSPFLS
jgi:hypothetical protein